MIVANAADSSFLAALERAAHPEEDVVSTPSLAMDALDVGFPRLLVVLQGREAGLPGTQGSHLPRLVVTPAMLAAWEAQRRERAPMRPRTEDVASRLRGLVERQAVEVTWVDRALADLSRVSGTPLPRSLRGFGRRVLEFTAHYQDLSPLADRCGLSRGALKARFRRRGLPSPYGYLRWFRMLATAHALRDPEVTVAQAASRLGFTSDGNLCRAMKSLTGLAPSEVRSVVGWNRLLFGFTRDCLGRDTVEAWGALDGLFVRRAA